MNLSKPLVAVSLIFMFAPGVTAQKKATKATPKGSSGTFQNKTDDAAVEEERKVRDIVAFLEYMLNTLGNSATPTRDKEVLITESYSKIFRDSKVQIEDDLDEERVVTTNKDIVAYLKDVNFFFKDARFEFIVENIETKQLPGGDLFYKVSTTRNLKATTIDHKSINNLMPRYIEINYNQKEDDLKIVSMYTNGIDEKRSLTLWWNELSYEWRSIFKRKLSVTDSVILRDIKAITAISELDLSNNLYIQNLAPLSQLSNLQSLDLSGTDVDDLTAIRNLTELRNLNLSNTKIKDLTPLKYSSKLERLYINNTNVNSLEMVGRMPELKKLELNSIQASDFSPIGKLNLLEKLNLHSTNFSNLRILEKSSLLTDLNLSRTKVQDINPLAGVTGLTALNLDSTFVRDLTPLSNLVNLKVLNINYTSVSSLIPLAGLKNIEKIYCDQTLIQREDADALRVENPKVLVVFDSNDLKIWWETLTPDWRLVLQKAAQIGPAPAKDELAKLQLMDSIDLGGKITLQDLEPLRKLPMLKVIALNGTGIHNLTALQQHKEIIHLDISDTKIKDLGAVRNFKKIKIIRANGTPLGSIEYSLPSLVKLYADNTQVHDEAAREFLEKNPQCLLIFKTNQLQRWWQSLSFEWKAIFKKEPGVDLKATSETLHALVEKDAFQIQDAAITNLSGLREFFRLKELRISGTVMSSITPLNNLTRLKTLQVSGCPLRNIDSLSVLINLELLDISNTPLEDIYPVWRLKNLRWLNCSGTQIRRLDVLERLENLEYLDCSNTNINKLNALDYAPIKTLKCFNTKLSARSVESFKAVHPDCDVQFYK